MTEIQETSSDEASEERLRKTLFTVVGAVVYWSQLLEEMLTLHVIVYELITRKISPDGKGFVRLEFLQERTLGQLVIIWREAKPPLNIVNSLIKVRDDRNYICHRMFLEDKVRQFHTAGLIELIELTTETAEKLKLLTTALDEMLQMILSKYGISIETVTKTANDMRQRAAHRFEMKYQESI